MFPCRRFLAMQKHLQLHRAVASIGGCRKRSTAGFVRSGFQQSSVHIGGKGKQYLLVGLLVLYTLLFVLKPLKVKLALEKPLVTKKNIRLLIHSRCLSLQPLPYDGHAAAKVETHYKDLSDGYAPQIMIRLRWENPGESGKRRGKETMGGPVLPNYR